MSVRDFIGREVKFEYYQDGDAGGMMNIPPEAKANGMRPTWLGYVSRGLYERFYRDTVENVHTWIRSQA